MHHVSDTQWEFGSFFHWLDYQESEHSINPWDNDGLLFGSGRDAYRSLLKHGKEMYGWKRLWVPSYFCQSVVSAFVSTGIDVKLYNCCPSDKESGFKIAETKHGDVILRVNFFGLYSSLTDFCIDRSSVDIIDDHSHDPWADCCWNSDTDWCVVSLRKTLPVPDGGVLWSPRRHAMPHNPSITDERRLASLEKLAAMALKAQYLKGTFVTKDVFRNIAISSEEHIASGDISGMPEWTSEIMQSFPIIEWRDQRRSNYETLVNELDNVPWLRLLRPDDSSKTCPFSGILIFDNESRRDYINKELVSRRVYLPVLWPLDNPAISGIPEEHMRISRTMLSVPCDMRYNRDEIKWVSNLVKELGDAYGKA